MFFTLPLPFYLGGLEFAPLARLLFLSVLVWGVVATEGVGGFQGLFALLAVVQVAVGGGLLWALAAAGSRLLGARGDGARAVAAVAVTLVLLGISLTDLYRTPISSTRPQSNLFGLFD